MREQCCGESQAPNLESCKIATRTDSVANVHYQQLRPSIAAARFVEFYWILEDPTPPATEQIVVPDGRAGIILNFARPFESAAQGTWTLQPQCFFVGQITGPLRLRPSGATAMIGIQFRPHGAAQLLGLSVGGLADCAVTLEDLSLHLYKEFARIRNFPSLAQAQQAIDLLMVSLSGGLRQEEHQLSRAIHLIEGSGGLMSIDGVAAAVGWSTRQLQRRFNDEVGLSPKFFARMQRFQGVLRAMQDPTLDWVGTANRCGYFDQAHLIRDFRQFSGKPPTALLDEELDFTRRFVQRPWIHPKRALKRS
jgi:AraC-like DNA-binding protein